MKIDSNIISKEKMEEFLTDLEKTCRKHGMVFYSDHYSNEPQIVCIDYAILDERDRLVCNRLGEYLRWLDVNEKMDKLDIVSRGPEEV